MSSRILRHCEKCGASFLTWPSRIRDGKARFCSKPCAIKSDTRPCEKCGAKFRVFPSRRGRNWARYCSASCRRVARFWSHVDRRGCLVRPELGPCWEWTGSRNDTNYGHVRFEGRLLLAHRASWLIAHGREPSAWVLHKCDNPPCVRPDHLFEGTAADNVADREAKGRGGAAHGEKHGRAKLTWEKVRMIRERAANGESGSALAREYRIAQSAASAIILGKTWSTSNDPRTT